MPLSWNSFLSIKDKIELRNFLTFFNEIKKNNLSEEVRDEHIKNLASKNRKIENELELLIMVLSKIEDDVKNKMIADIYSVYILQKDMPYFLFADMVKIIEQMFLTDFFIFGAYYETKEKSYTDLKEQNNKYSSLRSRYIGNLNTYEAIVSMEKLSRLGLVSQK